VDDVKIKKNNLSFFLYISTIKKVIKWKLINYIIVSRKIRWEKLKFRKCYYNRRQK
jgi:hypothetical protein